MPGCDNDPSYEKQRSVYNKEEGVKLPKAGDDDACTTGYNSDHCWTEFYFVESEIDIVKISGWDFKVLDLAVEGKVYENFSLKAGGSVSYKWDTSTTDTNTICTTSSAQNQCIWNDGECHQIWYAQRDARLHGYAMRVCNGATSGATQMNEQKSDGKWIRGMADFSVKLPINKLVGCNAKCGDTTYSEPTPTEPGLHPFDADW
ncbi:hypothetical protein F5Y18DRAFT_429805 [Xylariaceae sp. FL1019]|nr:hypothetical protein F5Y18DRAFT_429805 [Xylariaceae sp. FL1019]